MLSPAELQFIRDNCHLLSDRLIAERLTQLTGRVVPQHAVTCARMAMGIEKVRSPKGNKVRRRPDY